MIQLKKTILTLVALLAVTTGAWADETPAVTINGSTSFLSGSQTFDDKVTVTFSNVVSYYDQLGWYYSDNSDRTLTVTGINGFTIASCKFYLKGASTSTIYTHTIEGTSATVYLSLYKVYAGAGRQGQIFNGNEDNGVIKIEVFAAAPSSTDVDINWTDATKTNGTLTMPAGNVELEPEYYAQAEFATNGTPKAAEDAIAGTDAPLIEEGTVAKAGQTDDAQGQVMYAVTTTADTAPALTAFSATVPTAEDYNDATTVFVWYYIQGADAPTGTVPSDDNTFSDSDISGTPLQVNVLSNKFTLTFDPAPVEKVNVTVDGQTATPDEDGKIENVEMGKQVKLNAKSGFKLRKVKVKKTPKE